jgi:RHS repeat-associated protein
MQMPGRKFSGGYRFGFNGKENDNEVKGEGNQIAFEERIYDPRLGRFLSIDPIANKYPFQSPYVFAANNPIALIDVKGMGPGDPLEHKVVKGDNLTKLSKKYGVSIQDLMKMNNISEKGKDKLSIGQVLSVNPEANFSKNPRGGYQNPDNSSGKEVEIPKISQVGFDFVKGKGEENSVIVGGGALKSVQNWAEVKSLVSTLTNLVYEDGKAMPGEAYVLSFRAGTLTYNAYKGLSEAWDKFKKGEDPWKDNSQNSPIHVIGSFSISIRVNANGTTATISVYDSKTFKSFSDGKASEDSNRKRKDYFVPVLTNTYQRYIWNINL